MSIFKQDFYLIDLTHNIDENVPTWEGECGFKSFVDIDYKDLPVPFRTNVTNKIYKKRELLAIIDHLSEVLQLEKSKSAKIDKEVDAFIDANYN